MSRPLVLSDENYNVFVSAMIIFAFIFIAWGALNKVESGILYVTLILSAIGINYLVRDTIKEDKQNLKQLYKSPILQSTKVAIALYLGGYIVLFGINFIGKLFNPTFSALQFFSPLYLSGSGIGTGTSATYLASIIENTAGFKLAYGVFVAGTIEEYVFGFSLYLSGWILSMFLINVLFDNKLPFGLSSKLFSKILTYSFVVVTFTGIHLLNSSYEGIMFLWAGLFRLLMTLALYEIGLGLAFTIGLHHANNFNAFLFYEGVQGLGNFVGIAYILFLLLLLAFTIRNILTPEFRTEFRKDVINYRQ